jgi:hypothetical protein
MAKPPTAIAAAMPAAPTARIFPRTPRPLRRPGTMVFGVMVVVLLVRGANGATCRGPATPERTEPVAHAEVNAFKGRRRILCGRVTYSAKKVGDYTIHVDKWAFGGARKYPMNATGGDRQSRPPPVG